jgi:opacity protein-like surface antigen
VFNDIYQQGLSLGIDGFYGENKHDDFYSTEESHSKTKPYGIMGVALYSFSSGSEDPHLFGGLGWLADKFSGTVFGEDISETDSGFGYQLGAGIGFGLSESISIYGEGRYTAGTGDVSDTKFFSLLAGFAFAI